MRLLILRLEGTLQSWGERSYWDHRDTAAFPTKSGIVGLLGCALGLPRSDERLTELARQLTMAVRADRPGYPMTDFHTVQSRNGKMLSAEGKPRSGSGNTLLTPRGYLQDACFTVFLSAADDVLERCADALRHPVWVPCLGRRSCPPTYPLLPLLCDDYDSMEAAMRHFFWEDSPEGAADAVMRCELEDERGLVARSDVPIDAAHNLYGIRRVRYDVARKEGAQCT